MNVLGGGLLVKRAVSTSLLPLVQVIVIVAITVLEVVRGVLVMESLLELIFS